jgi:hypothetical protein
MRNFYGEIQRNSTAFRAWGIQPGRRWLQAARLADGTTDFQKSTLTRHMKSCYCSNLKTDHERALEIMKNKNHAVNLLNNHHINFLSQNQQAVVPESIVAQVRTVYFTMKENLPIIKQGDHLIPRRKGIAT